MEEEQNMVAYQYKGNIYYKTYKDVEPCTELMVWYGDQYANHLGIPSTYQPKLRVDLGDTKLIINPEVLKKSKFCFTCE